MWFCIRHRNFNLVRNMRALSVPDTQYPDLSTPMYLYVQDPDAPTRQQRRLSELDASDERSLNKHLFTCIRAGQLDKVHTLPCSFFP